MGTKENHFTNLLRLDMCDPVSGTLAALSVMQAYQGQEAAEKQAQAQKVLQETNQAILMIEGGVQAKEQLLKKIAQEALQQDKAEPDQQSGKAPLKK